MASLMERAQQEAGQPQDAGAAFQRPDISKVVSPEMRDVVDRVVAAGMRVMTSPEMRDDVSKAIQSQDPVPKKLAENVVGLLLMLDQKTPGGIPAAALFPVALELLGEAAEILTTAGQQVTQDNYNEAAMMMYGIIGQKLGAKPEELMGAAQQAMQGGAPVEEAGAASAAAMQPAPQPPQGQQPTAM